MFAGRMAKQYPPPASSPNKPSDDELSCKLLWQGERIFIKGDL